MVSGRPTEYGIMIRGEKIFMGKALCFDPDGYVVKCCALEGVTVQYRAYEGLEYCAAPADPIQKLNLYVPEDYYAGAQHNGYTLHTAPIFLPNTVGGYLPGPADCPGPDRFGHPNAALCALAHGYVVACIGVRGRTSGHRNTEFFEGSKAAESEAETGRSVGKAPAFVVDLKAGIRWLRHNKAQLPGDTGHIITNGTSAGGALSALAGASGNSEAYAAELTAIGALAERDNVFAANCFCPIHNLENADTAYEWMFCGYDDFSTLRMSVKDGKIVQKGTTGTQTEQQKQTSRELKALFPAYLNSLGLKDAAGHPLTLDENGNGSFLEAVKAAVQQSAQRELETHHTAQKLSMLAVKGSEVEQQTYLTIKDGRVTALDWDGFRGAILRMKTAPAFDALDMMSPENEEFGTESIERCHFTAYSQAYDTAGGTLAEPELIAKMNPLTFIGKADTAKHWRIRHGAYDRDTSLAIPFILATILQNHGFDVDFAYPWGLPHSGDYDLDELFDWIDGLCR